MLRKEVGISIPWIEHRPFFPWHWRDGSGSLRVGGAVPTRDLNQGQNRAVSLTNHLIVLSLCLGAVLTSPGAFRFVATPPP
jgi:hypothetical protein